MGGYETPPRCIWRSFLECDDLPASKSKLLEILNDSPKNRKLQVELAVAVDAGEPFVKAMYRLETDRPLVFMVYKEIATLRATISNAHYPNTNTVATKLSSGRTLYKQQPIDYANLCIKPAYDYFNSKFSDDDNFSGAVTLLSMLVTLTP